MSIGRIAGNVVKTVVEVVKKNPKTTAACIAGAVGLTGLIAYNAATRSRKQNVDALNHMVLINPYLNPIGFLPHMLNPNLETTPLDGVARLVVDNNNKRYQEYYDNLSPQEKIQEFYRNGGKGVNFDTAA